MLHLSRFLLSGGGYIALFWTVPWLAFSPRLGQNTPSTELFSQKNHVLLSNFFSSWNMLFIRLFLANTWRKKIGGHRARLREKENLFPYRAKFEGNHLHFVRARAYVRALMTRKSCAVEMPNAILRNYLKFQFSFVFVYAHVHKNKGKLKFWFARVGYDTWQLSCIGQIWSLP